MTPPFDDGLLDDEVALARADAALRNLAEAGGFDAVGLGLHKPLTARPLAGDVAQPQAQRETSQCFKIVNAGEVDQLNAHDPRHLELQIHQGKVTCLAEWIVEH